MTPKPHRCGTGSVTCLFVAGPFRSDVPSRPSRWRWRFWRRTGPAGFRARPARRAVRQLHRSAPRAAAAPRRARTPIRSASATNARSAGQSSNYGGSSTTAAARRPAIACAPATAAISRCKRSGNMTATELCKSFCPAAKTMVFCRQQDRLFGGAQRHALCRSRQRIPLSRGKVDNCTCNGKDAGGLAPLEPERDPTLRPGDIVATNDGLATFNGNGTQDRRIHADRQVRRLERMERA